MLLPSHDYMHETGWFYMHVCMFTCYGGGGGKFLTGSPFLLWVFLDQELQLVPFLLVINRPNEHIVNYALVVR